MRRQCTSHHKTWVGHTSLHHHYDSYSAAADIEFGVCKCFQSRKQLYNSKCPFVRQESKPPNSIKSIISPYHHPQHLKLHRFFNMKKSNCSYGHGHSGHTQFYAHAYTNPQTKVLKTRPKAYRCDSSGLSSHDPSFLRSMIPIFESQVS